MKLEKGVGFSKGWAELALKKPPPLLPELLDGHLRGRGPYGDALGGHRVSVGVRRRLDKGGRLGIVKGLDDALREQDDGDDDRERQQDVEHRAGHVHPEVAERARRSSGEKPRMRAMATAMPGGRRNEVLHGQPDHLGHVLHRGLAGVGLPVGVRDEADGGVEGQVRTDGAYARRAGREDPLDALEEIEKQGCRPC